MKELPFLDRFHPDIRSGRKVMTCRSKRYGRKGDEFRVPNSKPELRIRLVEDPFPIALGDVATKHYVEEGLEHPGEFIAVWNQLHPTGYDPDQIRFGHRFEVIGPPEKPIVAWNPDRENLVGQDGAVMTDAQETKARAYLDRDLIAKVSDATNGTGARVEFYEIKPLPGCKQTRRVWVESRSVDPTVDEKCALYTCDCQKAKGTARTPPGPCSHELAVRYFRQKKTVLA